MKKIMQKVKNLLLWGLSGMCALIATVYLDTILVSAPMTLAAFLMMPIESWQVSLGKFIKCKWFIIVTLLIVGFMAVPPTEPARGDLPPAATISAMGESALPTAVSTAEPTASPTAEPTASPTAEPTASPTAEPTASPTAEPTMTPTAEPTMMPTAEPTASPTAEPTASPTAKPTMMPTAEPTASPTAKPTAKPAQNPVTYSYVLNTRSRKFHDPSCGSADTIKESNRSEYVGTRQELIDRGYTPCGNCDP